MPLDWYSLGPAGFLSRSECSASLSFSREYFALHFAFEVVIFIPNCFVHRGALNKNRYTRMEKKIVKTHDGTENQECTELTHRYWL